MKKIANIIHNEALVNHTKVDYINYLEVSSSDQLISALPTLTVGWKYLNSFYKDDNISILNKEIQKDRIYWEFSFPENKAQHISGVDMFTRNAPIYYFESTYDYKLIDPVNDNIESIDELLNRIPDDCQASFNYMDKMVYLLKDNIIYGVDLDMCSFFDLIPILPQLQAKGKSCYADDDGDLFAKYNKIFNGYENLKRYLVTLM